MMACVPPRSLTNLRQLLLALLAIGLALRMGAGCEAMAATPTTPAAHRSHCPDIPNKPDKPIKGDIAACALCGALPDAAPTTTGTVSFDPMEHPSMPPNGLASLANGPAPPPPKIA